MKIADYPYSDWGVKNGTPNTNLKLAVNFFSWDLGLHFS